MTMRRVIRSVAGLIAGALALAAGAQAFDGAMPVPVDAIVVSRNGRRMDVDAHDVPVLDAQPAEVPATVSFQMTFRGKGRARHLGQGTAVAPTDPAAFLGRFFRARVRGTFSGVVGGFTFRSKRRLQTLFAEVGTEQSGAFLARAVRCDACGRPLPGAGAW